MAPFFVFILNNGRDYVIRPSICFKSLEKFRRLTH